LAPATVPSRAAGHGGGGSTFTGAPQRLRIPAIGVDTALDRLGLDAAGVLQTPANYAHAGWYAGGTVPGDMGPAVIAGHVDNRHGPAVFFRLFQLRPGDLVEVARDTEWVRFEVQAVTRFPKNQFPTAQIYGPTPDPQLRLITCGGVFNHTQHSYVDNIVVAAVLINPVLAGR
jgi:sortase (surface protein transpeptidase)